MTTESNLLMASGVSWSVSHGPERFFVDLFCREQQQETKDPFIESFWRSVGAMDNPEEAEAAMEQLPDDITKKKKKKKKKSKRKKLPRDVIKQIKANLKSMREDVVLVVGASGAGKSHMIRTLSIVEKFKHAADNDELREELEASFKEKVDVTCLDGVVPYHVHKTFFADSALQFYEIPGNRYFIYDNICRRLSRWIVKRIGCVILVSSIDDSQLGHVDQAQATLDALSRKFAQHNHKCRQLLYVANMADMMNISAEERSEGSLSDYYQKIFKVCRHDFVGKQFHETHNQPAKEFHEYTFASNPKMENNVDYFMEHHLDTAKEILNKIFNRPNWMSTATIRN